MTQTCVDQYTDRLSARRPGNLSRTSSSVSLSPMSSAESNGFIRPTFATTLALLEDTK